MNSDIGQRLEEELIEKTKEWLETAIELETEWEDDWSVILEIFKARQCDWWAKQKRIERIRSKLELDKFVPDVFITIPKKIVPINPDSKINEEVVNKIKELVDRFQNSEKVQPP